MRRPQLMRGYWRRPEATAQALHSRWLRTGDAGCLDAGGYPYITGRLKDMIVPAGGNVYPQRVENVLHATRP